MAKNVSYIEPEKLHIVGLDDGEDASHPLYDSRIDLPVDENLAKNITVYGVQHPVLVQQGDGVVYVVDGRQRVRAARMANEQLSAAGEITIKVPVLGVEGNERKLTGIMISTNEQRRDDDVLAKAIKAERMMALTGSKSEVALAFGRTVQTIMSWLKLAAAHVEIHNAVRSGRITMTTAVELAELDASKQEAALEELLSKTGRTAPEVTGKETKVQVGVKRTWIRKAEATKAFSDLDAEKQAVLRWVATGEAPEGSWMAEFYKEADEEIAEIDAMPKQRGRKKKVTEAAPEAAPEKKARGRKKKAAEQPEAPPEE